VNVAVNVAHRCGCVGIFTAMAAPLAIAAGFSGLALLLISGATALLCGAVGAMLWWTKPTPPRRIEGRGLAIVAVVLLGWAAMWTCSTRLQNHAARLGASASQSLRSLVNSNGR
jgi:hypothetical protein